MNAVNRGMLGRFEWLAKKGAPCIDDANEWIATVRRLEALFGTNSFPDLYLYLHWQAPIELGIVDRNWFSYYDKNHTVWGGAKRSKQLAVPEEILRPVLHELEEIMLRVAAFTGDMK